MAAGDDIQDNKLRDLLIDRMREAGIDVVADVEEGERVLALANDDISRIRLKKKL